MSAAEREVERLRAAIKKAHSLMGEHRFDAARVELSAAVNLYGEHLASRVALDKQDRRKD